MNWNVLNYWKKKIFEPRSTFRLRLLAFPQALSYGDRAQRSIALGSALDLCTIKLHGITRTFLEPSKQALKHALKQASIRVLESRFKLLKACLSGFFFLLTWDPDIFHGLNELLWQLLQRLIAWELQLISTSVRSWQAALGLSCDHSDLRGSQAAMRQARTRSHKFKELPRKAHLLIQFKKNRHQYMSI